MNSETSIKDQGLQPWQFFVLAALGCATAVTFVAHGQGVTPVVLLGVLMATAGFVGAMVLRAIRPLVFTEDDRTAMIGQRTRVALEREKYLVLKSIKELEFDRAMGKLSESDWHDMSGLLRARAARLMRQLDAGSGYREQIERDLARRLEDSARLKPSRGEDGRRTDRDEGGRSAKASAAQLSEERTAKATAERVCAQCATPNDHDARFCKNCGAKL